MKSNRKYEMSLRMNEKELNQLKILKEELKLKDDSKTIRYAINKVFNEIDEIVRDNTTKIEVNNDLLKIISEIAKTRGITEEKVLNDILEKELITDNESEKEKLERISINDKLPFYKKSNKEKDFNEIIEIATDTGLDELIDSVEAKNKIYLDKAR